MARLVTRHEKRLARHRRVRRKVEGTAVRPRLSVFRSLNNIYVQVIDDTTGHTLVAASSRDPEVAKQQTGASKTQVARLVGLVAAKRAIQAGVTLAVFDRGGYRFHGRVKSLAEGMREGGLKV